MSTTRRGFIGALLAIPFLARLNPLAPKATGAVPGRAIFHEPETFEGKMRAHEIDLYHTEANLYDKVMSPRERKAVEIELDRLRDRYAGPFPRYNGHAPHHAGPVRFWATERA